MPWSLWVGILRTPVALSTLLPPVPSPPLTPYFATLLAKDRGLFPCCHGDVAWEKCKGRTGKSRGEYVCSQVCLSRHVWKRVKGERENERKEARGGNLYRHHSPWGLVSVCNGVHARQCGKDCRKDSQCVNFPICARTRNRKKTQNKQLLKRLSFFMEIIVIEVELQVESHSHAHFLSRGDGSTSKLSLNLAIQTTICCFSVTLMAAQVKGGMWLHTMYPWLNYRATREGKWKHASFMVRY